MQSKWEMELWRAGEPVPDTKQDIACVNEHPGVSDWISDNFSEVVQTLGLGLASYFGIDSPRYLDGFAAGQAVLDGADKAGLSIGHAHVTGSTWFDEIRMVFLAWSEDELKPGTCQVVSAPSQAEYLGQTVEEKSYTVEYRLRTGNLPAGAYLFVAGAQDDGWCYDVAATSQAEVVFERAPKVPGPPGHEAPNVKVVSGVAGRYAKISTLLAEFGIDLGSPGANGSDEKAHYTWAYGNALPNIEREAVRKIELLAGRPSLFATSYAVLSTEMRKMVRFGHVGRDDPRATTHYAWADARIQTGKVASVRNELVAKLYVVLEPPIALELPMVTVLALRLREADRTRVDLDVVRLAESIEPRTRAVPRDIRNLTRRTP